MRLLLCTLLLLPCAVRVGHALPPPRPGLPTRPSTDDLERAFARRDPVELERLGSRLGPVRLVALVERGTPAAQRAALGALELTTGSLELLPRLIATAGAAGTDPELATATMDTVRRIAERVPRGELDLEELPADLPRTAADALAAFAAAETRPVMLRVSAVTALAALVTLDTSAAKKLAALVSTKDAQVRRAVADALPGSAAPTLARLISEDGNAEVAIAAAVSLCRDLPPPGAEKKGDRGLSRAAELPAPARARLRLLVRDAQLAEADRLDVVPCLRTGAQRPEEQPADLELLRELGRSPEGAMKRRARSFGGR